MTTAEECLEKGDALLRRQDGKDQHAVVAYSCGVEIAEQSGSCETTVVSSLLSGRAIAKKNLGKLDEAIADCMAAIQTNTDNTDAYLTGARCCVDQGSLRQARIFCADCCKVVAARPVDDDIHATLANISYDIESRSERSVDSPPLTDPFEIPDGKPASVEIWLSNIITCLIATAPHESVLLVGGQESWFNTTLVHTLQEFRRHVEERKLPEDVQTFGEWIFAATHFLDNARVLTSSLANGELVRTYKFHEEFVQQPPDDIPWQVHVLHAMRVCDINPSQSVNSMRLALRQAPNAMPLKLYLGRSLCRHGMKCVRLGDVAQAKKAFQEAAECYAHFLGRCGARCATFPSTYPWSAPAVSFAFWELANVRMILSGYSCDSPDGLSKMTLLQRSIACALLLNSFEEAQNFEDTCYREVPNFEGANETWIIAVKSLVVESGFFPAKDTRTATHFWNGSEPTYANQASYEERCKLLDDYREKVSLRMAGTSEARLGLFERSVHFERQSPPDKERSVGAVDSGSKSSVDILADEMKRMKAEIQELHEDRQRRIVEVEIETKKHCEERFATMRQKLEEHQQQLTQSQLSSLQEEYDSFRDTMYTPIQIEHEAYKSDFSQLRRLAVQLSSEFDQSNGKRGIPIPCKRMGTVNEVLLAASNVPVEKISELQELVCDRVVPDWNPWRVIVDEKGVATEILDESDAMVIELQQYEPSVLADILRAKREIKQFNASGGYQVSVPWSFEHDREFHAHEVLSFVAAYARKHTKSRR